MDARVSVDVTTALAFFARHAAGAQGRPTYRVVYAAPHAVYVHEDMTANHPNGGQAKFLEQPARQMVRELAAVVDREAEIGVIRGRAADGLDAGLRAAAEQLLAASLPLVPVDTGELKASGKVVREGGA